MPVLTEPPSMGDVLKYEVNPNYTREVVTLLAGMPYPGGSVEHWNEEAGAVWIERVKNIYPHMIWLNPVAEKHWEYTPAIQLIKQLVADRMYPLTLDALEKAMRELNR